MSRSKKWRLEWAFFLGENGRRQYNHKLSVLHAGGFEDTIQDQCHGHGQYAFEEKRISKRSFDEWLDSLDL